MLTLCPSFCHLSFISIIIHASMFVWCWKPSWWTSVLFFTEHEELRTLRGYDVFTEKCSSDCMFRLFFLSPVWMAKHVWFCKVNITDDFKLKNVTLRNIQEKQFHIHDSPSGYRSSCWVELGVTVHMTMKVTQDYWCLSRIWSIRWLAKRSCVKNNIFNTNGF